MISRNFLKAMVILFLFVVSDSAVGYYSIPTEPPHSDDPDKKGEPKLAPLITNLLFAPAG